MRLFQFLFILSFAIGLNAQNSFIKKLSHEEGLTGYQVTEHEGRIFLLSSAVCDLQSACSVVMEIDLDGDVLWEKTLAWLDVATNSMIVDNDTIMISGNHPSGNSWLWHHMSANGGDSLLTYEIVDSSKLYNSMFNFGTIKQGDKYCFYGSGRQENSNPSLLFYFDRYGKLDTLLEIFPTGFLSNPWDIVLDEAGNLTVFIRYEESNTERQCAIAKVSPDYEIVWTYFSEEDDANTAVPNGAILNDGSLVYNYGEVFNDNIHYLRALDSNGEIKWVYESPEAGWFARTFFELKTLANGSIIGVGIWADKQGNPTIDKAPWIINISSSGQLLWERVFYEISPDTGEGKFSFFFDVEELEDGSLMAIGTTQESILSKREVLIARLDSTGCLIENCPVLNDITSIFTAQAEVPIEEDISIFPNPASDILYINSIEVANKSEIYTTDGKLLQTFGHTNELAIAKLPNGSYFVKIYFDATISTFAFIR